MSVIATANPGTELADVVGQVGILTPPGDVNALVQAILQLAESPELRKQMGKSSVELVQSKWGREKVISGFQRQLKNLC